MFPKSQPSSSSQSHSPKSEYPEGCLQELLSLLRASDTMSFLPSLALVSFHPAFGLDYFLFSFHLLLTFFFFFAHFPGHLTAGCNYFYFSLSSIIICGIYHLGIKIFSIYLSALQTLVYSKRRYHNN